MVIFNGEITQFEPFPLFILFLHTVKVERVIFHRQIDRNKAKKKKKRKKVKYSKKMHKQVHMMFCGHIQCQINAVHTFFTFHLFFIYGKGEKGHIS